MIWEWLTRNSRWIGFAAAILIVLFVFAPTLLYPRLKQWVENDSFRSMLSKEVSKSMKTDGQFEPLHLDGLTVSTSGYKSQGWPGEAIGGLEAHQIQGHFNPWALFWRLWQLDHIFIDHGRFSLRTPDDALKRVPPPERRPWYAWLMPQRFDCRWIDCAHGEVEFPFRNQTGRLRDVTIGATMIGRDFKYFIKNGSVEFPLLPNLSVQNLVLLVTRQAADIENAQLRGLNGDPARVDLSGRIGMRSDKSIHARVQAEDLPFTQALPEALQDRLTGRITGEIAWDTDATGKNTVATGTMELKQARLANWPWLDEIARRRKSPELNEFIFRSARCDFQYRDNRFTARPLELEAVDKIRLRGDAGYDFKKNWAEIHVDFDQTPLSAWLPEPLRTPADVLTHGHLNWEGSYRDPKNSNAEGYVVLDDARLANPFRIFSAPAFYKETWKQEIHLAAARIDFAYHDENFEATRFDLSDPELIDLHGNAALSLNNRFSTHTNFCIPHLEHWLPRTLLKKIQGAVSGTIDYTCSNWNVASGNGQGDIAIESGSLANLAIQKTATRFLKNESLLKLDLKKCHLHWRQNGNGLDISDLDVVSPGKCGLRGHLHIDSDNRLSGTVLVGLSTQNLAWLPEATEIVFKKSADDLHWAIVHVSGTLNNPRHDLAQQILPVLARHPLAAVGLAFRGISWWLGDLFGTAE